MTTKQIDKKQAILDTALRLFVSKGFNATSTASIAKEAGVATGTLFHHFSTKNEVINQLFLSIKQEFSSHILAITINSDAVENDLEADANQLWQRAIDWAIEQPLKQQFFLQYSMSSDIDKSIRDHAMNSILGFIVELLKQGQARQIIDECPIELLLANCHGQYLAAIQFFTDHPQLGKNDQYRQASFQLFWKALRK